MPQESLSDCSQPFGKVHKERRIGVSSRKRSLKDRLEVASLVFGAINYK